MKIDKITNTIEQPNVWLCHRNFDKICRIPDIDDLKIYVTANALDEVSFTVHKNSNGEDFKYWDDLRDLKLVLVDEFGYFEIAVDKNVSQETTKVITGVSIESELAQINIDSLEINGDTDRENPNNWNNSGNYIQTVLCDISDTKHSLLHRLLSKAPHWKVGEVCENVKDGDEVSSVNTIHRTFNFDNTNIYDALQEISEEFEVVFVFDTYERSVNMYDLNSIGEDTTIFVSAQNLANDFTCSSNKDSIKNCFKIVGGDDNINAAVRAINPNGSYYIVYVADELKEDMSPELQSRLDEYSELFNSKKDEYTKACNKLYEAIDNVDHYETSMSPSKKPVETDASIEVAKLTRDNLGAIPVEKFSNVYETGAKKAVLMIAQLKVDYRYEVSAEESSYDSTNHSWTGKFKVENTLNKEDAKISENYITLYFSESEKDSIQAKINDILGELIEIDDDNIDKFRAKINEYSLNSLKSFRSVFDACANVLIEKGYSKRDTSSSSSAYFYNLYKDYRNKANICNEMIWERKRQVENAKKERNHWQNKIREYHYMLDFEKFLGKNLYKEFCLYMREDTYSNDNYISDGLSNSELLKQAKKLVDKATKQLYSSSLFQTTYTASLNNLFMNPIYAPFYDNFDLFNWIHAEIDNKKILLRLIGITFNFSSIESIEVEFSEQIRNQNGMTDLESIINQASSIATNYSSTVKKAEKGNEYNHEFTKIKTEGIDSATMNVRNSVNEEVVIDRCGITCRSKDMNDRYTNQAMRIVGNNIVLTRNNWESTSMAIGLGKYKDQELYGVWCDLLCGEMLIGNNLSINTNNGSFKVDEKGVVINKLSLTVSNGKNTLIIDPDKSDLFAIKKGTDKIIYLDDKGNGVFNGTIYANNGQFKGSVYANEGEIAGFKITNDGFYKTFYTPYLSSTAKADTEFNISTNESKYGISLYNWQGGVKIEPYSTTFTTVKQTGTYYDKDGNKHTTFRMCEITDPDRRYIEIGNASIGGRKYEAGKYTKGFNLSFDDFLLNDITNGFKVASNNNQTNENSFQITSNAISGVYSGTEYFNLNYSNGLTIVKGNWNSILNDYRLVFNYNSIDRCVISYSGLYFKDVNNNQFFDLNSAGMTLKNTNIGLSIKNSSSNNSFQITDTKIAGTYSGTEYFNLSNGGVYQTDNKWNNSTLNHTYLRFYYNSKLSCELKYGTLDFYNYTNSVQNNFFSLSLGEMILKTTNGLSVKNSAGTNYSKITDNSIVGNYSGKERFNLNQSTLKLNYYSGSTIAYQSTLDDWALIFKASDYTRCTLKYDRLKIQNSTGNSYYQITDSSMECHSSGSKFFGMDSGGLSLWKSGIARICIYTDGTISAANTIYSNGIALSSDKKLKEDIIELNGEKSLELINSLNPVEFVYKDNNNGRKHMGFIAQSTKQTFDNLGWDNMSIYEARVSDEIEETYYSEDIDDQYLSWTLKYTEFIAPMVCAIQELTKQNNELKDRIEKLEGKIKGE